MAGGASHKRRLDAVSVVRRRLGERCPPNRPFALATDERRRAQALAAWWNTTPTLLVLLNHRTKKLTYPSWSLKQLQRIPVPKPENSAWSALADAWREANKVELLPLRDAEKCPARRIIDEAAALALNVSPGEIADWRRRLSAEPTITNRRAARE